jgi:hypothetical protein
LTPQAAGNATRSDSTRTTQWGSANAIVAHRFAACLFSVLKRFPWRLFSSNYIDEIERSTYQWQADGSDNSNDDAIANDR